MVKMVKIAKNRFSISASYGHVLPLYGFPTYLPIFFSVFGSLFINFCYDQVLARISESLLRHISMYFDRSSKNVKFCQNCKNRVSSLTLYLHLLLQILGSVRFSISFNVSRAIIKQFYPSQRLLSGKECRNVL